MKLLLFLATLMLLTTACNRMNNDDDDIDIIPEQFDVVTFQLSHHYPRPASVIFAKPENNNWIFTSEVLDTNETELSYRFNGNDKYSENSYKYLYFWLKDNQIYTNYDTNYTFRFRLYLNNDVLHDTLLRYNWDVHYKWEIPMDSLYSLSQFPIQE